MKKVLIAGGTGLVGTALSARLASAGHEVAHLSRTRNGNEKYRTFTWVPKKGEIEPEALGFPDVVVNLAGASVARRWTKAYKQEILQSRVDSTKAVVQHFGPRERVGLLVNASAMGYYGPDRGLVKETDGPGNDFLAQVCVQWEAEARRMEQFGKKVFIPRIGIVLSDSGGVLSPLKKLARLGLLSPLSSGKQMVSWIDIRDMAGIIAYAIENDLSGAFNAVSPQALSNKEFHKAIAKAVNRPFFLPNVPAFVLRLALGEMADGVLKGYHLSADKITSVNYRFRYPGLQTSLTNLLHS